MNRLVGGGGGGQSAEPAARKPCSRRTGDTVDVKCQEYVLLVLRSCKYGCRIFGCWHAWTFDNCNGFSALLIR